MLFYFFLFKNEGEAAPRSGNNVEVEYINLGDAPNGLEGKKNCVAILLLI